MAYRYHFPFLEVSSKSGKNVKEAFRELVRNIINERREQQAKDLEATSKKKTKKQSRDSCVPKGPSDILIEGYLLKRGKNVFQEWKKRFVVLGDNKLCYFKTKKDRDDWSELLGEVPMLTSTVKPLFMKDRFGFDVRGDDSIDDA